MKYCWVCPKLFPESWQEVTSEATNLKASLAGLKYKSDRAQTAQAFREAKKLRSLGPCGFLEDRQQLVLHITSAPETSKDWDWVKGGGRVAWVGKLLEDKGSWTLRFWPDISCLHIFVHSLSDL